MPNDKNIVLGGVQRAKGGLVVRHVTHVVPVHCTATQHDSSRSDNAGRGTQRTSVWSLFLVLVLVIILVLALVLALVVQRYMLCILGHAVPDPL